jgi:hypothetical protein
MAGASRARAAERRLACQCVAHARPEPATARPAVRPKARSKAVLGPVARPQIPGVETPAQLSCSSTGVDLRALRHVVEMVGSNGWTVKCRLIS